jgi:hypothetical protein
MNIVFSIVEKTDPIESAPEPAAVVPDPEQAVAEEGTEPSETIPTPADHSIARKLMKHGHSPSSNRPPAAEYVGAGVSLNAIDRMLEKETNRNKTESWNRLDKTTKIQKLNTYAETYGREHALSAKDVKLMQTFFIDSLEKNKLQRTKDVLYDKETHEIRTIPALHYNTVSHNFTLRVIDITKRVSTLKSFTKERSEPRQSRSET